MNPVSRFFEHAGRTPDAPAFVADTVSLTAGALADTVRRTAGRLRIAGVKAGDVVGVATRPELDAVLILALMQLGATSLRATEPIARNYADHIDRIIADDLFRGAGTTPVITIDAQFVEAVSSTTPLAEVVDLRTDDIVRIVFSSGTTGVPKGVPFTADYLLARIESAASHWIPREPFMSLLGLDTVTGYQTFMWAMLGGRPYFLPGAAEANSRLIAGNGVAAIKTSPARLGDLLAAMPADFPRTLHVIEIAGSLIPAPMVLDCVEKTGVTPTYLYGSTEVGTVTRGLVDITNPNSVGTLVSDIEAGIDTEDGSPVAAGDEGMLRFRKAGMPADYWNNPNPVGHSGFRDGWFYPGDYGTIDAAGRLSLAGRRDDLVNAGGAKFNLLELDQWLQNCGLFLDAASFQFVDKRGSTTVGIAFVTKNAPKPEILIGRLREFLPDLSFGALARVETIPRNQLGKVERKPLAEKFTPVKGQR